MVRVPHEQVAEVTRQGTIITCKKDTRMDIILLIVMLECLSQYQNRGGLEQLDSSCVSTYEMNLPIYKALRDTTVKIFSYIIIFF